MNLVAEIGRLTADPEMKVTQSGIKVAMFSIAVPREYKNKDGKYDADFFRCVAYHSLAERIGKYTRKGDMVGIHGKLRQNRYSRDGKNYSTVEIQVEEVKFLTPKKGNPDELGEMAPLDEIPL